MALYSKQKLFCCVCGKEWEASAGYCEGNFDQGTCSKHCFREKEWRKTLSILGHEYYEKYSLCDRCETSQFPHSHTKVLGKEVCSYTWTSPGGTIYTCPCEEVVF